MANACVPPGPGRDGSTNGNAVRREPGPKPTRAVAGLPFAPGMTNITGWARLGPPAGIMARARWGPGGRLGPAWTPGRTAARGDDTRCNRPWTVPPSLARTGLY